MFEDMEEGLEYTNPVNNEQENKIENSKQARMLLAEKAKKRAKVSQTYQDKVTLENIKFPGAI